MQPLDGKKMAVEIAEKLKRRAAPRKFFAAVLVGHDPASINFLKQKEKMAAELGVDFRRYTYPENIKNDQLREAVRIAARHKTCGGVLVQLPLPAHLNRHYILNVIPPEKDVEVLGERALGAFYTQRGAVLPPAVATVEEILRTISFNLADSSVAVVGLGLLVGRSIALWLTGQTRELYLLGHGADFAILERADLVISGVGQAGLLMPEMLRDETSVIDFGCDFNAGGKICGDFDTSGIRIQSDSLTQLSSFYTPTPGGTGPILVAKLFENFYRLNGE